MSKQANKTLIGVFVVGAVAIVVAAVLIFGGNDFMVRKNNYVLFFTGSVKGLSVGAPVQFKGTTIGEVENIRLLMDPVSLKFYNEVLINVVPGQITAIGGETDPEWTPEEDIALARLLIKRGLRAKLEITSIVTGKLQVSFDFYPDTPIRKTGFKSDHFELPTIPSDLETFAKKIENIPFSQLVDEALAMVEGINQVVRSPKMESALTNLDLTLRDMRSLVQNLDARITPMTVELEETIRDTRQLVNHLDQKVDPVAGDLQVSLQSATAALNQANATLADYSRLVAQDSGFVYGLAETLNDLSAAANSIRNLADYLERHPESLLQGKSGGK